jgi:hypothetical protein
MTNRLFRWLTLALFVGAVVAIGCSEQQLSTKPGTYKTENLKTPVQKQSTVTESIGTGAPSK